MMFRDRKNPALRDFDLMAMIRMLGSRSGVTRREALTTGSLGLLGGALGAAERTRREFVRPGRAKSVIFLYLQGGPPTQDMFDLKPNAPSGIRSELKPIPSSAPGLPVCDLLPKTAKLMHRAVVVRSVFHQGGCHNNIPMLTGYDVPPPDIESSRDTDPPSIGSVLTYARPSLGPLPTYVGVPCAIGWGEHKRKPGQWGGFLGHRYDPLCTECTATVDKPPEEMWHAQLVRGEVRLPGTERGDALTIDAFDQRRSLLDQLEEQMRTKRDAHSDWGEWRKLAWELLTSATVRSAFDLSREPDRVRERYGRTLFGTSTLLARRLIERGVQFVNVGWDNFTNRFGVGKSAWDTHERNYPILRTFLPSLDQTYSALMEDLDTRGLLDQTLVVMMGEMGRTPKVNANGGRDHWTNCYSVVLAGAGLRGGTAFGASDAHAAFVKDRPVHIRDICATIYDLLGIDSEMPVYDRGNRPVPVAHGGRPLREVMT
jgi:hypothetical protein